MSHSKGNDVKLQKQRHFTKHINTNMLVIILVGITLFNSVSAEDDLPPESTKLTIPNFDCSRSPSQMGCWVDVTRRLIVTLVDESGEPIKDISNMGIECLDAAGSRLNDREFQFFPYAPGVFKIQFTSRYPYGGIKAAKVPVCPQIEIIDRDGIYQPFQYKFQLTKYGFHETKPAMSIDFVLEYIN